MGRLRGTLAVVALAVSAAACFAEGGYPVVSGTNESHPVAVGTETPAVALFVHPRPADRVELISAEGIGPLADADVRFYFSPPVVEPTGERVVGERRETLGGAIVPSDPGAADGPDRTFGIVSVITPRIAGISWLTGVRLTLRINGRQVVRTTSTSVYICAGTPTPADCEAPQPT